MMRELFENLRSVHTQTAFLECLEWDEKKLDGFMSELELMLLSSPPSIEKALFWLRNTPWESFGGKALPAEVYNMLEGEIKRQQKHLEFRLKQSRLTKLPASEEWN